MERINDIISGKDPDVEASFERLAAEIRACCMIAVREEFSSGQNGGQKLPRMGEQWVFTGNVQSLDVFSSSSAQPKQKIHGMECYSHGKLRRIEVLATVETGQRYVYFQGTKGMEFL